MRIDALNFRYPKAGEKGRSPTPRLQRRKALPELTFTYLRCYCVVVSFAGLLTIGNTLLAALVIFDYGVAVQGWGCAPFPPLKLKPIY